MNRNHLAIFHAVAEAGSISGGAEQLHISQPAVSKQISEFEDVLGVKLFHRLPRGTQLTEAGQLLSNYARRLALVEGEAERALQEYRGLKKGKLAVGASTTIGAYLLPQVFAEFHGLHPQIELKLEIANTKAIQALLVDGTIELALTEGIVETEDLESSVFHEDELVPIAPPSHPILRKKQITLGDLTAYPWIMREEGSGTRAVLERALKKHKITIQPILSLASAEAIKRAVASGIGLAMISRLAVACEIQAGGLCIIPVQNCTIPRPLHLQTLRGRSQSIAVSEFLNILNQGLFKKG